MPFESKPRIKFHKDPLIEVVCQLVFISPVQDMDTAEKLIQLHGSIKDKLPLFKKAKSVSLSVNTDNQSVSQVENLVYEFSTIDELVKVVVEPESITCVTTSYQSKEEFFAYINDVYEALKALDLVNPFKRVGLRYKDVIRRSVLGDKFVDVSWSDLLNDSLVSIYDDQDISKNILAAKSNFVISLNDVERNAKMNANYGVVTHDQTQEKCFMIDSDFYTEGVFDYDSANEFLLSANIKARDFFQWCIKPKLYDALNPEHLK